MHSRFRYISDEKQQALHDDNVNVGIAKTNDGKTCIICDRELSHLPCLIQFLTDSYTVRLVYNMENNSGKNLSYPLEYDIVELWKKQKTTYFAYVINGEVQNILELPIEFI